MNDKNETRFAVQGMTCGACVRHVEQALGRIPGVTRVEVELKAGTARVEHDAVGVSPAQMIAALSEAGYDARLVHPEGPRDRGPSV